MHFGEMIVDDTRVEFLMTNVTPVRATLRTVNMIAAIRLNRGRTASGTLWYIGGTLHRNRARFTYKIIGSAIGYVSSAATSDGTDLLNLGAALAPSIIQAGVHALDNALQMLLVKQTFGRTIVLGINTFLRHHFAKGTNQV